jgi:hypothetical protein
MAFAKRIINLQFQLGQGDFGTAGQDTVDLTGLRCSVQITKGGGGNWMTSLDLRVWGMPIDLMNKLTVLNKLAYPQQRYNNVTVMAGDDQSGVAVAFQGTIQEAWAEGHEPPDIVFHVSANAGMFERFKPIPPTSYNGSVSASLAFNGIAQQIGLTLENNGVVAMIPTPYWPGDAGSQIKAIAKAANCEAFIDTVASKLVIIPKGGGRGTAVLLNSASGLVGYPSFTQSGVQLKSLYKPSLVFLGQVVVESEFTGANGTWVIAAIDHQLESGVPGGSWFTNVECGQLGHELPIIGRVGG